MAIEMVSQTLAAQAMTPFEIVLLSVIEGITEFLPISSTGHMILASTLMGIEQSAVVKLFTISIQLGAILSVVVLYWRRFFSVNLAFYRNIVIGTLPAVVLGLLFEKRIDEALASPWVVVASMIIGGVVLVLLDHFKLGQKSQQQETNPSDKQNLSIGQSVSIGFFQCLAMVPGTSRSASTIVGGLIQGLSRKSAAEFSFFLAVPVMLGATSLKLWKAREFLTADIAQTLLVGNLIAFVVALLVVRGFILYLSRHGLKLFGYYRILAGLAVLVVLKWWGK